MRRKWPVNWPVKYNEVLYHFLFWLGFMLYHAISYGWENTDELTFRPGPALVNAVLPVSMLLTYLNLYVLMPVWYYRGKYISYAVLLMSMLLAGGVAARALTHVFVVPWERLHDPVRYGMENKSFWIPVRILRLSLEFCPLIAVSMLLQLMRRAYSREKNLRALEQEKFAAEMVSLKAQINPHFFFNTLNTLYGLIIKKSDIAEKFALRLGDLMHYVLYQVRADKVLLKDEIDHLENYISVEEIRFANRLELSFQYSGDIDGKMIAPLILLPLVENAFKHGIGDDAGWITININVVGNRLLLNVENSYPSPTRPDRVPGGLGLSNVKRRLDLIYPRRYVLQQNRHPDVFESILKLDL